MSDFDLGAMRRRYPSASVMRRLSIQAPGRVSQDLLACLDELERLTEEIRDERLERHARRCERD